MWPSHPGRIQSDSTGDYPAHSQEFRKRFAFNLCILEDLIEQPWPQCFSRVNGDDGGSPVGMAEEVVAAFDAQDDKADSLQCSGSLPTRDSREFTHASTAIR